MVLGVEFVGGGEWLSGGHLEQEGGVEPQVEKVHLLFWWGVVWLVWWGVVWCDVVWCSIV